MKLLILTQKVNSQDPILGFFHRWIEEFALHYESVVVICLEKGDFNLPKNVRVLSLGKETKKSRLKYLINFYKYIWLERKNYDQVFVHMNQIYVLLGFFVWKILGKKVGLWYTHKAVTLSLRLATYIVDFIFTASSESFLIKSKKLNIVGHGIDILKLKPITDSSSDNRQNFSIITVGRISKVKNQHILIEAISYLKNKGVVCELVIVGGPVTGNDFVYLNQLKELVHQLNLETISFLGPLPNHDIITCLYQSDLFINLSDTGSLDKAVLEAMASGTLVLSSNKAFESILQPFNLYLTDNKSVIVADKINDIKNNLNDYKKSLIPLRNIVVDNHDLNKLIKKIYLILCNK